MLHDYDLRKFQVSAAEHFTPDLVISPFSSHEIRLFSFCVLWNEILSALVDVVYNSLRSSRRIQNKIPFISRTPSSVQLMLLSYLDEDETKEKSQVERERMCALQTCYTFIIITELTFKHSPLYNMARAGAVPGSDVCCAFVYSSCDDSITDARWL